MPKEDFLSKWDVSGIIGLSGETSGIVAISMKADSALIITSNLTKMEHTHIDSYVTDALGEIISIISGNAKKSFEDDKRINISLPSIIRGKAHFILWPSEKHEILCMPFTFLDNHEFCLSMAIEKK